MPDPACQPCSVNDECGGAALCIDGQCQACTVTCDGDASDCGEALQAALDGGGPISVCPGRYAGSFAIDAGVELVGAGDGGDPSTNTILDAQGAGRVLAINADGSGEVTLAQVRITGGDVVHGAGILNSVGRTLTMTRCTVSGNSTANANAGGGINNDGTLTLSDCRIENNTADSGGGINSSGSTTLTGNTQVLGNSAAVRGGGIFVVLGAVTIDAGCQVTANTAPDGEGGGIHRSFAGTVNLANDQIVTENSGGNCASEGEPIANCDG